MKKTFALLGATALGVIGVGVAAAPAQAVPVPATEACADVTQHTVDSGATNWYNDCVPQFGAGKAEFSIDVEDAPEGFLPLTDEDVVATTDLDTKAASAYGMGQYTRGAFTSLEARLSDDETQLRYGGNLTAPIAGVENVEVGALAAECGAGYDVAYRVSYRPVTTQFIQTIGGEKWRYDVVAAPEPKVIAFSFSEGDLSWGDPICVTDGTTTVQLQNSSSRFDYFVYSQVEYQLQSGQAFSLSPFVEAYDEDDDEFEDADLGVFARWTAPVVEQPAPQPAVVDDSKKLAETGADAAPALIGAGGLLAAGLAALVFRGRRRENATR